MRRATAAKPASKTRGAIAAFVIAGALGCGKPTEDPLVVSAAADLQDALTAARDRLEAVAGTKVEFNFGASGMLFQQIEAGAKVDVFASANVEFVDKLIDKDLADPDTKRLYAVGRLAVWSAKEGVKFESLETLLRPEFKRIALANPVTAPYGAAASEALFAAGVHERLKDRLVFADNARQSLQYAESGDADAAFVSASLVRGRGGSRWIVPGDLHRPIAQAAVAPKSCARPHAARKLLDFLAGPEGADLLAKYGFERPPLKQK